METPDYVEDSVGAGSFFVYSAFGLAADPLFGVQDMAEQSLLRRDMSAYSTEGDSTSEQMVEKRARGGSIPELGKGRRFLRPA